MKTPSLLTKHKYHLILGLRRLVRQRALLVLPFLIALSSCDSDVSPAASASATPAATAEPSAAASPASDASPTGGETTPVASDQPRIVASPNPVPAAEGPGTTMITWSGGTLGICQVYVVENDAQEKLLSEGTEGAVPAPWIQTGSTYDFRLYAGTEHKQLLSSVKVTRAAQ